MLVEVDGMREPMNMMDAMKMAEAKLWVGSVKKEVAGLVALGCWEEVDRSEVPRGRTIAPSHFVFKIKTEEMIEEVKDEHGKALMAVRTVPRPPRIPRDRPVRVRREGLYFQGKPP